MLYSAVPKSDQPDVTPIGGPVQRPHVFPSTHWSVVLAAGNHGSASREQALENLCHTYWYPIYGFVRRLGHTPADAEDLTQGFIGYLLERELISRAQPETGRFRSFLLGSLQRWLSNQRQREHAVKRGAGKALLEWDALSPEARYVLEPATEETPAARFDRTWAETLVGRTLERLQAETSGPEEQQRFALLSPLLSGGAKATSYGGIGLQLGMSEGAVKVAVHRLRKRWGELLRAGVAETVDDPAEVETELRHLLRVLSQ
jgi:RNA polymerase sigma-70 factor (ECF subfamily)